MTDLEDFGNVKLIDRNKWVLARQLDGDAGTLVTRKIRELGLDVLHQKRVAAVSTDAENNVTGITFEDGEHIDCCCICFAVCFDWTLLLSFTDLTVSLDWRPTKR